LVIGNAKGCKFESLFSDQSEGSKLHKADNVYNSAALHNKMPYDLQIKNILPP
jgi:hypothetical protein